MRLDRTWSSVESLRKLLAILLACVFGFPLVAPAFAIGQSPESRLPACCRKSRDHHCAGPMAMMDGARQRISPNPGLRAVLSRCPYSPGILGAAHPGLIGPPALAVGLVVSLSQHALPSRNASMRRIERDRSYPDRSPPTASLG